MIDHGAYLLRETTGTSGIETTLRDAVNVLAHYLVPHLVAGGLAVQEHGYYRVTTDVDIIVSDVFEAVDLLTADLSGPFETILDRPDSVRDKRNRVVINLLPAQRVLKRGCVVPFPRPTEVKDEPQVVTLEQLVSLKLDSWFHTPLQRAKDRADVIELIIRAKLPRDLRVHLALKKIYEEIWDGIAAEPPLEDGNPPEGYEVSEE